MPPPPSHPRLCRPAPPGRQARARAADAPANLCALLLAHHPSLRVLKLILVAGFGVMVVQGGVRFANIYSLALGDLGGAQDSAVPYIVVNAKATYAVNHPSWLLFNLVMVILAVSSLAPGGGGAVPLAA